VYSGAHHAGSSSKCIINHVVTSLRINKNSDHVGVIAGQKYCVLRSGDRRSKREDKNTDGSVRNHYVLPADLYLFDPGLQYRQSKVCATSQKTYDHPGRRDKTRVAIMLMSFAVAIR
jgi:hypothetical protein